MIGNKSPVEMRRILRERLAINDGELLAAFNEEIAEAKAKNPESSHAGDALQLLSNALLRKSKRKPRAKPKKKQATVAKK